LFGPPLPHFLPGRTRGGGKKKSVGFGWLDAPNHWYSKKSEEERGWENSNKTKKKK